MIFIFLFFQMISKTFHEGIPTPLILGNKLRSTEKLLQRSHPPKAVSVKVLTSPLLYIPPPLFEKLPPPPIFQGIKNFQKNF